MSRERRKIIQGFRRMIPWEILAFSICGVLFPMPYLLISPWFTVQTKWLLAAGLLPAIVLFLARQFLRKGYWFFQLLFVAGLCYVLWRLRYEWGEQFWLMNDSYLGILEEETLPDITLFIGLCMATWATLVMALEATLAGHLILCAVILGVMLVVPMIDLDPGFRAAILPLLFAVGFWWLHDQKRRTAAARAIQVEHPQKKIHVLSLWIILLTGAAFLAGIGIVTRHAEPLFETAFDIEGRIDHFLDRYRRASGTTGGADIGSISQANSYPSDQEYLQVYTDHEPKQDLYLYGFRGGFYEYSAWDKVDETEVFKKLSSRLGWEASGTRLTDMFENMYFMQNQKSNKNEEKITLAVKRIRQKNYSFQPYFSHREKVFINKDGWERNLGVNVDVYSYYETHKLYQDLSFEENYTRLSISLHMLENLYLQMVQEQYTQVPEGLEQLRTLVQENPKEDLQDITSFILYTLKSKTTYSLTPGLLPLQKDACEYFLFENGKGFCEHYASTAALLYRLYGIPARYASGYRIPKESFVEAMGGYWVARATGQQSHAWVEIFLPDYGWVPVDVTPGDAGQLRVDYPGYDLPTAETMLEQEQRSHEEQAQIIEPEIPDLEQYLEDLPETTPSTESQTSARWQIPRFLIYLLQALLAVGTVILMLETIRKLRLAQRRKKNCRKLFVQLTRMLYAAGMSRKADETEEAFAQRAARFLPSADLMHVYEIAEQEAFGNRPTTDQEKALVLHALYLVAEKIRADNLLPKRLWYRWGKAYW